MSPISIDTHMPPSAFDELNFIIQITNLLYIKMRDTTFVPRAHKLTHLITQRTTHTSITEVTLLSHTVTPPQMSEKHTQKVYTIDEK